MSATIETNTASTEAPAGPQAPRRRRGWLVGAAIGIVALIVVLAFALSGGSGTKTPANQVGATLRDKGIQLAAVSANAGDVSFRVTNRGTVPHEFVVFGTDAAANNLPLGDDGAVNEDAASMHNVIDSGGDIAPGHSATFHANLPAGHYVVVCNLPGHYKLGMHTDFTVK